MITLLQECEEACQDEFCDSVLIEVCAEVTREAKSQAQGWIWNQDFCDFYWVTLHVKPEKIFTTTNMLKAF